MISWFLTTSRIVVFPKDILTFWGVHNSWILSKFHFCHTSLLIFTFLLTFIENLNSDLSLSINKDTPFNPPYSSLSVGYIKGGQARNIIPNYCYFDWEVRPLPEDDPKSYELLQNAETIGLFQVESRAQMMIDVISCQVTFCFEMEI